MPALFLTEDFLYVIIRNPTPMAARPKVWVYDRSLVGIAGSNLARGSLSVVSVVCCRLEIPESG
jgi:hypothetical protein